MSRLLCACTLDREAFPKQFGLGIGYDICYFYRIPVLDANGSVDHPELFSEVERIVDEILVIDGWCRTNGET